VESVAATHCLDACAVIAYVRQEPGAEVLKALIERPTTFLAMHVCNLRITAALRCQGPAL
jgi:uncharacterized protein with PIN domain